MFINGMKARFLSLLALLSLRLLCFSQPSEVCSLRKLLTDTSVSDIFKGVDVTAHEPKTSAPGAILTVWAGPIPEAYNCQVDTHKRYAQRHGYAHYIVNDTAALNWEEHVNSGKFIDKYWFKLLAMIHIMKKEPKHPWVLYIDADNIFEDEIPGRNMSIENHFHTSIANYKDVHVVFSDKKGFSTDFIFAKNSPMGLRFVEHFWSLRHVCPGCVEEQCAGHIAMLETLLFSTQALIDRGETVGDNYHIDRDKNGRFSCCNPRSHCRCPHGPNGHTNHEHGNQVQGCVWKWEAALQFTGEEPKEYPYIKMSPDFRSHIGIHHWYKQSQKCEEDLQASKGNPNFRWREWGDP